MPKTVQAIMTELAALGSDNIKKILLKHGVREPFFGVKIEHLKPIQKRIKKDYKLANDLFLTGNADAMYLAGLIADDEKMTKDDLQAWVKIAESTNISGYTVPWVAGGSHYGFELGMEWIEAEEEHIAVAGWATLSGVAALKPDTELDLAAYKKLLARVEKKYPQLEEFGSVGHERLYYFCGYLCAGAHRYCVGYSRQGRAGNRYQGRNGL